MTPEPLRVALRVIEALEDLSIPYHLGGSFASSLHGVPRQTQDLDLVVDLQPTKVALLVSELQGDFYVEPEMIRSALRRRGSFNLVHLETGFKVDVFVKGREPFDAQEFERHHPKHLTQDPPRQVMVKSAEDTILRKLEWYQMGGQVSDRQWNDILGVLRVKREELDEGYLRRWARELRVEELLEQALAAASPD